MTAQDYVDWQIAWHLQRVRRCAGTTRAFVHVRAVLELRQVAVEQYRPARVFVPFPLLRALREGTLGQLAPERMTEVRVGPFIETVPEWPGDEAYRHRLQLERQLPYIETPDPPTSPIYAALRRERMLD